MNIISQRSRIKTLKQNDPDFRIIDGIVTVPRAGFEISENCPAHYQKILMECWGNGWIKPVAHMMDYEYTMDKLKEAE
jgi:hypothetical protein